jgi:uncharacterized membrane protein
VRATKSGYLQIVDADGLVGVASKLQLVVRLEPRAGEWVQEHAPLFSVWPASAAENGAGDALRDRIWLGNQRSIEQDAAFGIRQLVDVAVKAISPGINDPTSATDCIDRLGQILVAAGRRQTPHPERRDGEGVVRVVVPYRAWDDLVDLAFDQLRQYGRGSADIALSLLATLATVALATPPARHEALRVQARRIGAAADAIPDPDDRRRVAEAVARVLAIG